MSDASAVRIAGLTLTAGGRTLLENADLTVPRGGLVLLVGASGSGKSVTLSLLLGLFRPGSGVETTGDVSVLGVDPRVAGPPPRTGVVFQDFALFDDWDARTNVAFAADHGATPRDAEAPERLLAALGLPPSLRPARMSGGQKQRLAIARALAGAPELVFYDEPTSGLDPAMSAATAELLRSAHDRGGMTSIVVTHDLAALAPVADRIVLLDPLARKFRDVPHGEIDGALAALRGFRPPAAEPPAPARRGAPAAVLAALGGCVDACGRAVLAGAEGLAALAPRFPRAAWGRRFLAFYARLLTLGPALPFLCLAGAVSGFVVAFFLFELVPYAGFTEPVLLEEIVAALGYALFRVVAPGTVALLFAARGAAAASADFGRRTLSRQTDALRVCGVEPRRYLLSAALLSALLGAPVLWWLAWKCAAAAAALVFLATHPAHGAFAFDAHFGRLIDGGSLLSKHAAWSLGKTLVGVFGATVVAWRTGTARQDGGGELARGVTRAVVRAILWVLFVQLVFSFMEFAPLAAPR